jgi:predicted RNase H-like HicB family nuclease
VLSPDPAGGYSVRVPAVPGAISEGDSRDEAIANIREAIAGVLALMREQGRAPAPETPESVASEIEKVLGFRAEEWWDLVVETAVIQLTPLPVG